MFDLTGGDKLDSIVQPSKERSNRFETPTYNQDKSSPKSSLEKFSPASSNPYASTPGKFKIAHINDKSVKKSVDSSKVSKSAIPEEPAAESVAEEEDYSEDYSESPDKASDTVEQAPVPEAAPV